MIPDKQKRPIRVSVAGMNERMKNTLRFFFQGPCNNHCVLVEENSAELGIIDLDGFQGRKQLEAYRERHPGRPLIVLSLRDVENEDTILLRKPLNPEHLISALDQIQATMQSPAISTPETTPNTQPEAATTAHISEAVPVAESIEQSAEQVDSKTSPKSPLESPKSNESTKSAPLRPVTHQAAMYLDEQKVNAYIGSAPDIDRSDTQQLARAQYDPSKFFQGYLRQAVTMADDHMQAVELKTSKGTVVVMPNTHFTLVGIEDSKLRNLCAMPVIEGTLTLSVMENGPSAEDIEHTATMSLDSLLWKVTLWSSRGRLPIGTNPSQPVFLRRWPNMTRLILFPHALRIAALWTDQIYSLLDTAKALGIPQRYVFSFYSAANALGLAAVCQREADMLVEPAPVKKNRQRGLFSRILDHLRKNG